MTIMKMIVCPTTHNDWDWQCTFPEYYTTGYPGNSSVRHVLQQVVAAFAGSTEFCFSYAECAFLRAFLNDPSVPRASVLSTLQGACRRFSLLGGGIVSPDNLVCDDEVFIRNYLVGHAFLREVGLLDHVCWVGWLPDDFGHSPQLPVLIEAMGMTAIGLSRIPGSPQPALCPRKQHADHTVRSTGITFDWQASDGSHALTQFMPETYYGLTHYGVTDSAEDQMSQFLSGHGGDAWPNDIIFVTQGGDWQFPQTTAGDGGYDWQGVLTTPEVTGGGYTAAPVLGTFADYFAAMMKAGASAAPTTLYAENYYTGHFASRPALKTAHYRASRTLVGAEVLASLLTLFADDLDRTSTLTTAIAAAWQLLVPTSHHDFVTGTSPDNIYDPGSPVTPPAGMASWDSVGQLAMSRQCVALAEAALRIGMTALGDHVQLPALASGEIAVLVFNQLGCDLPATAVVELPDPSAGTVGYQVKVDGVLGPVQRTGDSLLFQVHGMTAMSYRVVVLVPTGAPVAPPRAPTPVVGDHTLDNGCVKVKISQSAAWAITSLVVDHVEYVPDGGYANLLSVWSDNGNIYQFGNEFMTGCNQGSLSPGAALSGVAASLLEAGPIRWRVRAEIGTAGTPTLATTYDLIAGERLIRITTTGAAASSTSVLTSFALTASDVDPSTLALQYGTAYHWEDRAPQGPSWGDPTFRASHDFATLTAGERAAFGVYHHGVPAWTLDGAIVRGCVLRNTPNTGRAEHGSDTGTHTQHYTLDVGPQVRPAVTGYPLRTAQYAHTALHAMRLSGPGGAGPARGQLASVAQADAMISVAKPAEHTADGERAIVLRIQHAGNAPEQLDVTLPFLAERTLASAHVLTALENPLPRAPAPSVAGTVLSTLADRAVWTVKISTT